MDSEIDRLHRRIEHLESCMITLAAWLANEIGHHNCYEFSSMVKFGFFEQEQERLAQEATQVNPIGGLGMKP